MKVWIEWSTKVFIGTTLAWLLLFYVGEREQLLKVPHWMSFVTINASILSLPGALTGQVMKADKQARLGWAALILLVGGLAAAMLLLV